MREVSWRQVGGAQPQLMEDPGQPIPRKSDNIY